jgi:hypothetical protein
MGTDGNLGQKRAEIRAFLVRHGIHDPAAWQRVLDRLRQRANAYTSLQSIRTVCRVRHLSLGQIKRALYDCADGTQGAGRRPSYILHLMALLGWDEARFRAWLEAAADGKVRRPVRKGTQRAPAAI